MTDSVRGKLERLFGFFDRHHLERPPPYVTEEQARAIVVDALAQLDELKDLVEDAESKSERDDDYGAYLKLREFSDAILGKQGETDG